MPTGTPRPPALPPKPTGTSASPPIPPPSPTGRRIHPPHGGDLPKHFAQTAVDTVVGAHTKAETVASRKASQLALESFTAKLPELLGARPT